MTTKATEEIHSPLLCSMGEPPKLVVGYKAAARTAGVSESVIRHFVETGKLRAEARRLRPGGPVRTLFRLADLEALRAWRTDLEALHVLSAFCKAMAKRLEAQG